MADNRFDNALRERSSLAPMEWEGVEVLCCASCGEPLDERAIDFEVDVAFCPECSVFEYDEDYFDLGGEG
jgi:hypothetical protein